MLNFARPALLGALALGLSAPASADVRSGVEAYQRGDYAAALREWRPLADRGDPDAQFNLAQAYKLGRGVPANLDTAIGYYRKAADRNHEEAQALLGLLLYQNGKRAEAMPWLGKAADRGDPAAQYVYGSELFNGELAKPDWPRAYGLMTRAAAQGLPPARQALLEMDKTIPLPQRQQGVALARGTTAGVAGAKPNSAPFKVAMRGDQGPPARPTTPTPSLRPSAARSVAPPARTGTAASSSVTPVNARAATTRVVPTVPPVAATRSAPAGRIAGWKVQLGAFAEGSSANALFASLKGRVPALAGAQPMLVRAGAVTRLQAGPFANRAAANAACASVKARTGSACFPVAP